MQYTKLTYEILAYKALNRDIDEMWVNWAFEMLGDGYDSEHLRILAGITKPYNQFVLQMLTAKALRELSLEWHNKEGTIKNYALSLIGDALLGGITSFDVLKTLKDICIELDNATFLIDFYLLFFAKQDLMESDVQWYWHGANRENIDEIITDYFQKWRLENSPENV